MQWLIPLAEPSRGKPGGEFSRSSSTFVNPATRKARTELKVGKGKRKEARPRSGERGNDNFAGPFRQGLRELGYIEGQNILIEWRYAEGRSDRAAELAAELVRLDVAIIVALPTPAVQAAKNATKTIPIVMGAAGDPVGLGLVESLARPGGNITGLSSIEAELGGKRLELLGEIVPNLTRVAILASTRDPFAQPFVAHARVAAENSGIFLQRVMIGGPEELERAFSEMAEANVQAVVVQPLFNPYRVRLVELSMKQRLPLMASFRETTEAGGLISFGANFHASYKRAAVFVDKILKGAKPADLPVEQPTEFDLAINVRTAKALGLTIPPTLLARADEVIE